MPFSYQKSMRALTKNTFIPRTLYEPGHEHMTVCSMLSTSLPFSFDRGGQRCSNHQGSEYYNGSKKDIRENLRYATMAFLLMSAGSYNDFTLRQPDRNLALCESVLNRSIDGKPESYARMVLERTKQSKTGIEQNDAEETIYGQLEDADPSWASKPQQMERMAIAQINANEQLEDRAVLQQIQTLNNGELLLAGVMDGHGGWQVADYVQRKVGAYVEREINKMSASRFDSTPLSDEDLSQAMRLAFLKLDDDIMRMVRGTCDIGLSRNARVGACCVVALVTDHSVIVANTGDCRAVMDNNGTAHTLSHPHSADEENERSRLQQEHPGEDDIVICKKSYQVDRSPRNWLDYPWYWTGRLGSEIHLSGCYVKGRLQPTRSFGDFYLKMKEFAYDFEADRPFVRNASSFPYITAEPEVKIFARNRKLPQFILLASDGVWDFLSPAEAVDIARNGLKLSPQTAAVGVIQSVLRKASADSGVALTQIAVMPPKQKRRIFDDTTVCIVKL